jgi:hypothetical protein
MPTRYKKANEYEIQHSPLFQLVIYNYLIHSNPVNGTSAFGTLIPSGV